MNVLAVREAAARCGEHARTGKGPMILEMMTYRYRGHSMSDPAKYRTREEVDRMRNEHDPIERRAIDCSRRRPKKISRTSNEIRGRVAEAAEFAQTAPSPNRRNYGPIFW